MLGTRSSIDWDGLLANYDRIREHIEHVVPGFEDYNQRARQPGGFYLPNPIRKLEFNTDDGRAHFTVHELPRHDLKPGQFLMMTMRSHDQFNTTIYGLDDRYRGIHNGRRVVFLNADDIRFDGLQDGQMVDLISHFEGEERIAHRFRIVTVQHSASLCRDLLSGNKRARAGAQLCRQEPHAGIEVGGD